MIKKSIFWAISFALIFLLSQDFLFASWTRNAGFLGFPDWLFYFILVQILWIIGFYFFSKKFWDHKNKP